MNKEEKYNLWLNGFNVNWIRTRLPKRVGSVIKNKYFRLNRNEHNRFLKQYNWFK